MSKYKIGDNFPRKISLDLDVRNYIFGMGMDLKLALVFLLLAVAFIFIPGANGTILRPVLGFTLALFTPGYVFMAAIFPGRKDVSGMERLVLSFASSLVITPLIGVLLNATSWGIRLEPILICLIPFIVVCVLIANKRRHGFPPEDRFSIDFINTIKEVIVWVFPADDTSVNRALSIILLISVLLSFSTVAYILIAPKGGENYTELYILGPNGTMTNYSTNFFTDASQPVITYVVNHEHRDVPYELVVTLNDSINNTTIYHTKMTLVDNQTWNKTINVKLNATGEHMKLKFDLFADGNKTAPYREVYLWVNSTKVGKRNTDFVVTGRNGTAYNAFRYFYIGDYRMYTISVSNHEYRDGVPYLVDVVLDDGAKVTILYSQSLILDHNQTWTKTVKIFPDRVGNDMKLAFQLYMDGDMSRPEEHQDVYIYVRNDTNTTNVTSNMNIMNATSVPNG